MKRQLMFLAAAGVMASGLMLAAPQDASQAPPPDQAQGPRHAPDPSRQVKMLTKRLNLSQDQQQQLLPVLQARQQAFESLRNDSSLAPADRREKMRAAREDSETKIKAILNDSQKQQYEQMQQQMREHMKERHEQSQQQQSPQ